MAHGIYVYIYIYARMTPLVWRQAGRHNINIDVRDLVALLLSIFFIVFD